MFITEKYKSFIRTTLFGKNLCWGSRLSLDGFCLSGKFINYLHSNIIRSGDNLSAKGLTGEDSIIQPLIPPLVHHVIGEMRCLHLRDAGSPYALRTWTPSPIPGMSNWAIPHSPSLTLSARGLYCTFTHSISNHATPEFADRVSSSPPRSSQSNLGSSSGTGRGFLWATTSIFISILSSCCHSSISHSSWLKWVFFLSWKFMIVSIEWLYLIYFIRWSPQCRGFSTSSPILITHL